MKKSKRLKQIFAGILAALIIITAIAGGVISVFADEVKIVTLGADLSNEQRTLILNYFNVSESEVEIITVNNEDEHAYLDGIATQQQIGTHTYSCAYIEPTSEGGIHIKTVNLSWVTCEMVRNALITSGITNCNVICAAPKEVSGTGALTGIFKAYQTVTDEKLDDEKVALASSELVTTMDIAETVGQEEAATLLSDIKEEVIVDELKSEDEITESLDVYLEENSLEITDEQKDALIQLLLDISKQDYSVEDIKNAYQDIKEQVQNAKDAVEKTMNFFEKIWDWIQTTWEKITGKYDEIVASEEAQAVKEQLGILAQTNDDLLGTDTVVTITEDEELINEANDALSDEDITEEEKQGIIDNIIKFFKGLFSSDSDDEAETVNETETAESIDVITFDTIKEETYDEDDILDESTESGEESTESGVLGYVNWEMQNSTEETTESGTPSLDDLTK